jgi:DNA-binding winged helix-turn-helix (wHTH) protein
MSAVLRFRDFTLDTDAGLLSGPHGPVSVRPKALALLELLVRHAGRVLSKDELLDSVWAGVTVNDETLTQTVHELRRALGTRRKP